MPTCSQKLLQPDDYSCKLIRSTYSLQWSKQTDVGTQVKWGHKVSTLTPTTLELKEQSLGGVRSNQRLMALLLGQTLHPWMERK